MNIDIDYWNFNLTGYAMGDAEIPYWQDYQVCLASKYINHIFSNKNIVKYRNIHPSFILRKMPFGE